MRYYVVLLYVYSKSYVVIHLRLRKCITLFDDTKSNTKNFQKIKHLFYLNGSTLSPKALLLLRDLFVFYFPNIREL